LLLIEKGIYIMESLYLEELSRDGVSEFLFVALPLKIRGATGSMIEPNRRDLNWFSLSARDSANHLYQRLLVPSHPFAAAAAAAPGPSASLNNNSTNTYAGNWRKE